MYVQWSIPLISLWKAIPLWKWFFHVKELKISELSSSYVVLCVGEAHLPQTLYKGTF